MPYKHLRPFYNKKVLVKSRGRYEPDYSIYVGMLFLVTRDCNDFVTRFFVRPMKDDPKPTFTDVSFGLDPEGNKKIDMFVYCCESLIMEQLLKL